MATQVLPFPDVDEDRIRQEVALFAWPDIPWPELAFPSVIWALKLAQAGGGPVIAEAPPDAWAFGGFED